MADKKKEEQTLDAVQAQAGAEGTANASDGYSAAGLNSRKDVEDALTNASYKPGQSVTDAAQALKEWQANRPKDYQSNYQEKIDQLLDLRKNYYHITGRHPGYKKYSVCKEEN